MSPEVAQKSNELDIDDGTLPIEDAAQTEETAQIDDDGDVDGSQVSEAETADDTDAEADDATTTEGKTEEAPKAEGTEPVAEAPKPDAKPSEWKQYTDVFREEFGAEAAKPFEALIAKLEKQQEAIDALVTERQQAATRSDQQVAAQHMTAAGIDAKKQGEVYQDAVDYFMLRQKQNRAVSGIDALKWAIRSAGGNPDKSATPQVRNSATAKAEKLQGLRSIPPKSRQAAPELDLNDPAVADGTAPVRSSR